MRQGQTALELTIQPGLSLNPQDPPAQSPERWHSRGAPPHPAWKAFLYRRKPASKKALVKIRKSSLTTPKVITELRMDSNGC